jgi:hypothetical protein
MAQQPEVRPVSLIAGRHHLPDLWRVLFDQYADLDFKVQFGENPSVGTSEEDLWTAGGKETLLTTGTTLYLSSTEAGADQTMLVEGLDENWDPYQASVALTGQSQVQVGNTGGWTRVFNGFQISPDPSEGGDVYIAESDTLTAGVPDTAAKVHGHADFSTDGNGAFRKAMITVPKDCSVLVLGVLADMRAASAGAARSVNGFLEAQLPSTIHTPESPSWAPFRKFVEFELTTNSPQVQVAPALPTGPFPAFTNIHLRAAATAASDVNSALQYLLIRNN